MNPVSAFCLVVAALCFLFFLVSFLRDRRRLRNGVYLFLGLIFLAFSLLVTLDTFSETAATVVLWAAVILIPLFIVALAIFLITNGVTMIRNEGARPVNLLSLTAGVGIVGFIGFEVLTAWTGVGALEVVRSTLNGLLAYISFLFMCFLLYSILYGRIRPRGDVDFVVVLGSGILGTRVPPLLASRLDRGRAAYDAAVAKGRQPAMVTSGGQGPGEDVSESQAMADYLVDKGVPRDRILLEDQSTTTLENLTFSGKIMRDARPDYRCLVVTNNFHVLRAALLASKAKVNGQVIGAPTAWYFWPNATLREFVAVFAEHWVVNGVICLLIVASQLL